MAKEIRLDVRKTGTIKIGLNQNIWYANDYMLDLLGYNLVEFIGQKPKIVCSVDMPGIIHDEIGAMIQNYERGIALLKHQTRQGDYFWAFTHFRPSYKEDGSFDSFLTRRKPLPLRKLKYDEAHIRHSVEKLYSVLKEIETHHNLKTAKKYLQGFLEDRGFENLTAYFQSFFNLKPKEIEEYFSITPRTPQKIIKKYMPVDD